jgi:PST family polysaccharide transporter
VTRGRTLARIFATRARDSSLVDALEFGAPIGQGAAVGPPLPTSVRWLTWSALGLGAKGLAQFVVTAVLARFLGAAEFGVVSATLIVIGFGRAATYGSIGPALVQRPELRAAHLRSASALVTWGAVALVAALWLLAPAAARFFGMESLGLADVMRALSLVFLLEAAGVVSEALLQRELDLRRLALAELTSSLLGFVPAGVGLALAGFGVWALVGAYVAQALLKSIVLVAMRPHERSLRLEPLATRELLYFTGGFLPARIFNYTAAEGDNFVVGKWMSAAALGIYGRAYQMMAMPAMFLGEVIDRILFPLMARAQLDTPRLALTYSRGVALIALIMAPASALGIVLAPEIVRVVLGPGWDATVGPFRVLLAGLLFRSGYKISDSLARATGTVYARMWRQGIFAGLVVLGALLGAEWSVEGVAAGIVGALAVNYALMAGLSLATTAMGWPRFLALHGRGLLLGLAVGALALAAAAALRGAGAGAFVVLAAGSALPCAAVLAAARWRPRAVLGEEGLWLLRKLTGRDPPTRA